MRSRFFHDLAASSLPLILALGPLLSTAAGGEPAGPAPASEPTGTDGPIPVRAVFFDLGNTLAYRQDDGRVVLFEDARSTIADLKSRGIRVGVITNVPADWSRARLDEWIGDAGFLELFEVVLMSSEAPAPKPDPRIFEHALSLMNDPPPPHAVAFVAETPEHMGDTPEGPTSGARAAGWIGILKAEVADPRADLTVPDLATLTVRLRPATR